MPGARFAVLGVIGFEHFGHVGAAAMNISMRDTRRRIFLVELPMLLLHFRLFTSNDSASRVRRAP
jgi:hypothetical protein